MLGRAECGKDDPPTQTHTIDVYESCLMTHFHPLVFDAARVVMLL